MATWVIGDVHGCHKTLRALWARLEFDKKRDHLWMTGDLVNRGPDSLSVLKWAKRKSEQLGPRFVSVLGNHDVYLLAIAEGVYEHRQRDTLDDVLNSRHCDELLHWLRRRPLVYRSRVKGQKYLLVHAGVLPGWRARHAAARAKRAEALLRTGSRKILLRCPLSEIDTVSLRKHPGVPRNDVSTSEARIDLNILTRIRTVTRRGALHSWNGAPKGAPSGVRPWFADPAHQARGYVYVFGHWAALGLQIKKRYLALDSGCVWGSSLTALRLEDRKTVIQEALE